MPPTQLFHPSPKRKRDQQPVVPLLNTALRPTPIPPRGSPPRSTTPDSPRNAVADQLRGMSLAAMSAIPMSPLTPTDDVIRKKPKLDAMRIDGGTTAVDDSEGNDETNANMAPSANFSAAPNPPDALREIPETPDDRPRTMPDVSALGYPTTFESPSIDVSTQQSKVPTQRSGSKNRSSQALHRNPSPSPPPLSALTWQDNEITGHLVDPSVDPDDDGTGLNGIGFRPTPAIAHARAQKRRQQLMDWRARESRDARAKRSERRRRGVGGIASRESTVGRETVKPEDVDNKRTVKFAI